MSYETRGYLWLADGVTRLDVIDATMTVDEQRMPFRMATVTVRTPTAAQLAQLNPTIYPIANLTLWGWDRAKEVPDNGRALQSATMTVTGYTRDIGSDSLRVSLSSPEFKLQQFARAESADYIPGAKRADLLVVDALSFIGETLAFLDPSAPVIPDPASRLAVGQTLDAWTDPFISGTDRVLYADANIGSGGNPDPNVPPPIIGSNFTLITNAQRTAGQDSSFLRTYRYGTDLIVGSYEADTDGAWADAAVQRYTWTDPTSKTTQVKTYAAKSTPSYHKTRVVNYDAADPGTSGASALLARAKSRSLKATFTVPIENSDDSFWTGTPVNVVLPEGTIVGIIRSITWDYPSDRLTFTLPEASWK